MHVVVSTLLLMSPCLLSSCMDVIIVVSVVIVFEMNDAPLFLEPCGEVSAHVKEPGEVTAVWGFRNFAQKFSINPLEAS